MLVIFAAGVADFVVLATGCVVLRAFARLADAFGLEEVMPFDGTCRHGFLEEVTVEGFGAGGSCCRAAVLALNEATILSRWRLRRYSLIPTRSFISFVKSEGEQMAHLSGSVHDTK